MELGGEARHYLYNVRRLREGDTFLCADGDGRVARVRLVTAGRNGLTVAVEENCPELTAGDSAPDSVQYHVYVPHLKGRAFDRVLRQITELGAHRITPILTGHCVSRPSREESTRKHPRYEAILREACQQSGRPTVPELTQPLDIGRVPPVDGSSPGIVFHEAGTNVLAPEDLAPHGDSIRTVSILTGPEGGLAQGEVHGLHLSGWAIRTLPVPILRAETAPVAALAIVAHIVSR